MNEVWQRTILSNSLITTPWEVTYGPDGYLWVTGSHDYKAYRMDPNTGTKTTILDLSMLPPGFSTVYIKCSSIMYNCKAPGRKVVLQDWQYIPNSIPANLMCIFPIQKNLIAVRFLIQVADILKIV